MRNAQMIAAVLLSKTLDSHVVLAPRFRDEAAAAVRCRFFKTGRFGFHELAQRREHPRQAWLQAAQEFFGGLVLWHGVDMLTTLRKSSNLAAGIQEAEIAGTRIAGTGLRI
jgi:hypothetical protein